MLVRIGIPHRGGRLAFHAFTHGYAAMVSASAFWNASKGMFSLPVASDVHELDFALDSAGFTAMKMWQTKGRQAGIGGVFPWTYEQYIELALTVGASWWSQPDLCCEPEIAKNQEQIDYRISATATFLEGCMQIVDSWSQQFGAKLAPPVPIIQGWTASDYTRSLDLMMQVWSRWSDTPPALIGVGSVCRRHITHPEFGLLAIINALETHLPAGSALHLFGVKGSALSELKMFDSIASVDSMAYDFRARMKAREETQSYTMQLRATEMSRWMEAAENRIAPSIGDQFRLIYS
jgi:hypothetical protein